MKRNIIHLTGIVLCAIGLFSGCDKDLPSYTNLTVDAETLTINLDAVSYTHLTLPTTNEV